MSSNKLVADTTSIQPPIAGKAARAWSLHVSLLIGSGVIASAQIGKAIISIPLIRNDLALGLDLAGLIVATFATLGALTGIGAGVVVSRFGVRQSLIAGMSAIALGNVIGAGASHEIVLLFARVVEGIGFLGVVLAIPSMLARIVISSARDFVMAIWSAYMPTGIMLMLFAAPLLPVVGWRNFWLANAAVAIGCALSLAAFAPAMPAMERNSARQFFTEIASVIQHPRCLVLGFAFFAYSCQIFSLTFALPLLLTSAHGTPLATAGLLSALILAVSTIGHLSSGVLLRVGVPLWASIALAFGCFALSGFAVYGGLLPPQGISYVAALALGIGGLAPGALYAAAPHAAPKPSAVPPTIGLLQQASSLGQFTGPVVLGLWVEHFGWHTAPAILAPGALFGLISAFVLRRILVIREVRSDLAR